MGPLSWVLLLLAINGALMTGLLLATSAKRQANIFLAALTGLISLRLLIYVLGFAGVYDEHPGITFLPLDASLAFGPCLWLYVVMLTHGRPPRGWRWHFAPAAVQLIYSLLAFALPLEAKLRWFRGPHLDWVEPNGLATLLISSFAYLVASAKRQRSYQRWLDQRFSNRERWRLGWLTAIITAFGLTLFFALAAALINAAITPLNYFARTPVIVVTALLAYALGMLGWRYAELDLPHQLWSEETDARAEEMRISPPAMAFEGWSRRVQEEGWWREEGLTLARLARLLCTSERTLSRSLSEGGGCSFHDFINGLRVSAIKQELASGAKQDLLSLALQSGFSSKASFNRAFLRHTGVTPSRWRQSTVQSPPKEFAGAG